MNKKIYLLVLFFISISGCSTNEVTGRKQLNLVGENEVIDASSEAYASQMADYRKEHKIETDPKVVSRVKNITDAARNIRLEVGSNCD
jgi:hypothetical protein